MKDLKHLRTWTCCFKEVHLLSQEVCLLNVLGTLHVWNACFWKLLCKWNTHFTCLAQLIQTTTCKHQAWHQSPSSVTDLCKGAQCRNLLMKLETSKKEGPLLLQEVCLLSLFEVWLLMEKCPKYKSSKHLSKKWQTSSLTTNSDTMNKDMCKTWQATARFFLLETNAKFQVSKCPKDSLITNCLGETTSSCSHRSNHKVPPPQEAPWVNSCKTAT